MEPKNLGQQTNSTDNRLDFTKRDIFTGRFFDVTIPEVEQQLQTVYDDDGKRMAPVNQDGSIVAELNDDFVPTIPGNENLSQEEANRLFEQEEVARASDVEPVPNVTENIPTGQSEVYLDPAGKEDSLQLAAAEKNKRLAREAAERERAEELAAARNVFERETPVKDFANRVLRGIKANGIGFISRLIGAVGSKAPQSVASPKEPAFDLPEAVRSNSTQKYTIASFENIVPTAPTAPIAPEVQQNATQSEEGSPVHTESATSPDEALLAAQEAEVDKNSHFEVVAGPDSIAKARISRLEKKIMDLQNELAEAKAKNFLTGRRNQILQGEVLKGQDEVAEKNNTVDTLHHRIAELQNSNDALGDLVAGEPLPPLDERQQDAINSVFDGEDDQPSINLDKNISSKEGKPKERLSIRERFDFLALEASLRIRKASPNMYDFYINNREGVKKVALGVGLVSASMALSFAAPVGTVATAAVWGAKLGLRGYGAYKAGEGVEKILRARVGRKQPGEKLSRSQERKIRDTKVATMIAAFALGSIFDWYNASFGAASGVADQVAAGVDTAVSGGIDVAQHAAPAAGTPATGLGVEIPSVTPDVPVATAPVEAVARHADTLGTTLAHEVTVKSGDTLSHIILSDGLAEIIPPEELAKLSARGKQNFISNLVGQLSPEQLRGIGIESGDLRSMKVGEHIDIKKLAAIAKDMSITVDTGGSPSKLSLLARALGLS